MTSPYGTGIVTAFSPTTGNPYLDPLIVGGFKWGNGGVGVGTNVTYSFPTYGAAWNSDYAIYLDNEPFNGFTPFSAAQQAAAASALAGWAEVANITFQQVADTAGDVGDIRFGNSASVTNSNAAAWAYFPYDGFDSFEYSEAGDVWFDAAYGPNLQLAPGQFGYSTMVHEIGHAIGLDHPFADVPGEVALPASLDNQRYSIMSYTLYSGATIEAAGPMLLDILAAQYLYGANMTTRAGDDSYVFSNSTEEFKCIWDAGGFDTFDLSNQTLAATIDLRAGNFSSIGRKNNGAAANGNIGIAYNVTIEDAIGGSGSDKITGNDSVNHLWGGDGNDMLTGGKGNDSLIGSTGDDILIGGEGDDYLHGTWGNDIAKGGSGNDTYAINAAGDVIDEEGNADTGDVVRTVISVDLTVLGAGAIEHAVLLGATALNATGNNANNTLTGNDGVNVLDGAGGNDMLTGGKGNDSLIGSTGDDILIGGEGDDYLHGTWGNDIAKGGSGNDTYAINAAGDVIDEEGNADTGDVVRTVISVDLTVLGAGAIEHAVLLGATALNATGNNANNTLTGNDGANVLDGAGGDDTLTGGKGNDTYVLDSLGDVVNELVANNAGGGVEKVISAVAFNLAAHAYIEHLTFTGNSAIDSTGNALDNQITGNDGVNVLDGAGGNDMLTGGKGNDSLIGSTGDDILIGGEGDDYLHGTWGNDIAKGGSGNDTYAINAAGDVIDEEGNADTGDVVRTVISVDLTVLGAGAIEHAVLLGATALNATGNNANNTLTGNNAVNVLAGGAGIDTLLGNGGNDRLVGGDGADIMTGGADRDAFDYNLLSEVGDTITDFALGAAGDILDLTDLLGDIGYGGVDPFLDSILSFTSVGADTLVAVDADGLGSASAVTLATLLNVTLTQANTDNYLV